MRAWIESGDALDDVRRSMQNARLYVKKFMAQPKIRISCFRMGEASTDIVPFNVATSTLLADKLVEIPRDIEFEREELKRRSITSQRKASTMRHDEVLQKHRSPEVEPPKVVEWLEMRDPETNKVYYHNKVTGKSMWNKPEGFDEAMEISAQAEESRASFWIEVQDSKGRPYYYDLLTRETRWDRPVNYDDQIDEDDVLLNDDEVVSSRRILEVQ